MKNNRLFAMLIVATLIVVTILTAREAMASESVVSSVDSATRSYTGWAQAVTEKGNIADSATRSYTAWAKAVETGNSAAPAARDAQESRQWSGEISFSDQNSPDLKLNNGADTSSQTSTECTSEDSQPKRQSGCTE